MTTNKIYVVSGICGEFELDIVEWFVAAYTNKDEAQLHYDNLYKMKKLFPRHVKNPYDPNGCGSNAESSYKIEEVDLYTFVSEFESDHHDLMMKYQKKVVARVEKSEAARKILENK